MQIRLHCNLPFSLLHFWVGFAKLMKEKMLYSFTWGLSTSKSLSHWKLPNPLWLALKTSCSFPTDLQIPYFSLVIEWKQNCFINNNVILKITNLFKVFNLLQAQSRDREEKEAEDILGHSNIWRSVTEGGGSKRHKIKYLGCIILGQWYSSLNMKLFSLSLLGL